MHQEHPDFEIPKNKNLKMWRYISLPKFLSLLETSSLYFTRADKFSDPFEGTIPKTNEDSLSKYFTEFENSTEMQEQLLNLFRLNRKITLINCWYLSEYESDAMWQLYSTNGIAIQTNVEKFINTISASNEKILLGKVKYLDYDNEGFLYLNALSNFLYKRISFEHEKEIRAVIWNTGEAQSEDEEIITEVIEHGRNVRIDINELIENIYVSPTAPTWFHSLIVSLVKRYNINKPVIHSKLYSIEEIDKSQKEVSEIKISKEILEHFSKKDSYRINEENLKNQRERFREYENYLNEILNLEKEIKEVSFIDKKNKFYGKEALLIFSKKSFSKTEMQNIFSKTQFKKIYFTIGKIDNLLRELNESNLSDKEKTILLKKIVFFYSENLAEPTIYITSKIEHYQLEDKHLLAVVNFTKSMTELMFKESI